MQYISSLMHLPFSEDKRRKPPPPERSDKNWIFDFDFPVYFTAESRGCTKGNAEFPFVINNVFYTGKAGVWGYAVSPQYYLIFTCPST